MISMMLIKNVSEMECISHSKESQEFILSHSPYIKIENDNFQRMTDGSANKCEIFFKNMMKIFVLLVKNVG